MGGIIGGGGGGGSAPPPPVVYEPPKPVFKPSEDGLDKKLGKRRTKARRAGLSTILSGGGGGKTYEKYNPRRTHTASADGQPPSSDTGFLASNIVVNLNKQKLEVDVESRADYSIHLEFGTQNMKARPFMFPALEENKPKIRRMYKNLKGKPK